MGAPLATVAAFNAVLFSTWGALERILGHEDGEPIMARLWEEEDLEHPARQQLWTMALVDSQQAVQ